MERLRFFSFPNLLRRAAASFALIGAVAALLATASDLTAGERASVGASTVVFVCAHGAVKSTVAAAHFNRIARERGLPFVAVSRGIDLYPEIPASIRTGLATDGLAPNDDTPRDLRADEASAAARVIAFDPVPAELGGTATVTYWQDMPAVTKDYSAGREAIVRRIEQMVDDLAARSSH
jgi:protein-tyrosine-phosphatase